MAGSVKIKITGDSSDFENRLKAVEGKVKKFGSGMSSVFKGIMSAQVVTQGLSLLKSGLEGAASAGMSFEASMSNVAAISGATGAELDALTQKAKEMGASTKFSASQAGEAFGYMAMAGWKTEEMMAGIDGVMKLAASSGEDLGTVSDIVTDALTALGMKAGDAGHFADVLAAAASNSNTNVGMMGETFKYVAPLAGALGYSAEDLSVAIGLMANAGIKGTQAGTALRSTFTRLSKPTKDVEEAMKALGISAVNSDGSMKPLNQLLLEMRAAFDGLSASEKTQYAATIAGQEAMSGFLAIVNASDADFEKLTGAINECSGAAQEMSDTQINNLQGDVTILQSALEGLQITAYESFSGVARAGVQELTGLVNDLTRAGENGGIGGMFDALIGQLPNLIDKVMSAFEGLVEGLVKKLPDYARQLANGFPNFIKHLADILPMLTEGLFEMVGSAVGGLIANLPRLVPELMRGIGNMFVSAFNGAINGIGSILNGIGYAMSDHTYENIMSGMLEGADKETVASMSATINADIDTSEVKSDVDTAIDNIREILKGTNLDEDTQLAIVNSIKNSSGIEVFKATLQDLGLKEEDITAAETALHHARDRINKALASLGTRVPTVQKAAFTMLQNDAMSDEDKIAALQALGVEKEDAIKITQQYNASRLKINDALYKYGIKTPEAQEEAFRILTDDSLSPEQKNKKLIDLGIPPMQIATFRQEVSGELTKIGDILARFGTNPVQRQKNAFTIMQATDMSPEAKKEALKALGIPDEDVDEVYNAMTAARSKIGLALASIGGLSTVQRMQINQLLNNGATEAEISAALQKMGIDPEKADATAADLVAQRKKIGLALAQVGGLTSVQKMQITQLATKGATEEEIKDALIAMEVDPEVAATVASDIYDAANNISTSYDALGKLSDEDKDTIYKLATEGATEEEIASALEELGVDPGEAQTAAREIKANVDTVSDALGGIGGLGPEEQAQLSKMIAEGASEEEISNYLQDLGFKKTEADRVASEITGANDVLVDALMALGLTPEQARAIALGATSDETLIRNCLQQLGVPDSVIDEILSTYDSVATGIAGKLNNLYSSIYKWLTDGEKDTEEDKELLKQQIMGIYDDLYSDIDDWEASEEEKLKKEGKNLDPEEYAKRLKAIQDKGAEMRAELEKNAKAAAAFLDDMAGKNTQYCTEHMGELQTYLNGIKLIEQELNALMGEGGVASVGYLSWQLVSEGKSTDRDRVTLAMKWAKDQQDAEVQAIREQWATQRAAILGDPAALTDPEGNAEKLKKLDESMAELEQGAKDIYDKRMMAIFAGLAGSDEGADVDLKGALDTFAQAKEWFENNPVTDEMLNDDEKSAQWKEQAKAWKDNLNKALVDGLGSETELSTDTDFDTFFAAYLQEIGNYLDTITLAEDFPNLSAALAVAMNDGMFSTEGWDEEQYKQFIISLFTLPDETVAELRTSTAETTEGTLTEGAQQGAEKAGEQTIQANMNTEAETELTNGDELADDVTEQAQEALDGAGEGSKHGKVMKMETDAEVTVKEVTTPDDSESPIEDAVKDELSASVTMDVDTALSLNISVSDSNAATVGAAAGTDLGNAMASAIMSKSMKSTISNATAELMTRVVNMAEACKTLMYSSGQHAADGFRLGLLSKIAQVEAAARKVANAAADAVTVKLEISSPSRLMRRLGDFTGQGFEMGLTESLDRAVHGAQRVVGALNLNPNTAANGIVSAINGNALDTEALGEAISRRPVVLNVNGREFARATQRDTQIMQRNAARRAAMGVSGV